LAFGILTLASVLLAVVAADHSVQAASSPIEPTGRWRPVLVGAAALSFSTYAAGIFILARSGAPVKAVGAIAVVMQLAPLAGPTLLSTDTWTYWMYGRISAVLGANPYVDAPSAFRDDVAFGVMGSSWQDTTSLYGPLFTIDSELLSLVAGDDPSIAALLFRVQAALAVLGIAAVAGALARNTALAVAFVGWSPLLALHFAGGGHNDALMMLLVLSALLLAAKGRVNLAGIAWAAAIAIKWVPLAFLGLWLLYRWRRRLPLGATGLLVGAAAIAIAALARYGPSWVEAVSGVSGQARRSGSFGLSSWLGDLGLTHRPQLVVVGAFLLTSLALLARAAWQARLRLGLSGTVLALGQSWLNPWYGIWGVSLSAPEEDDLARIAALALSALLLYDAIGL
jgi:hypothetical protein